MEAVKVGKNLKDIKELFRARVEEYYKSHHEETDVPEAELPALFYQPNQSGTSIIDKSSSVVTAFNVPEVVKTKPLISESSSVLATPIKECEGSIDISGTPVKEVLAPIRLMANTPAIKPSKRRHMSPEDVSCDVPTKLVRRPIPTRSLKFDFEDKAETQAQDNDALASNVESGVTDFLPKDLLQSVRERERKILEEQDPAISQARRRHQLMSDVPRLFDMIHLLFQSSNRSVMTKEELMYKIITGHSDIIDRGEVEEQFKLLNELAPEYISERDTLVCVKKSVSAQSIRAKLS